MAVATYDPKKIEITFGSMIISGYADGTFVSIASEGDGFERMTGAAGDVAFVNKQMWCYDVTLTLLQTSHSNSELTLWYNMDKLTNSGLTTLTIKDHRGNSLLEAAEARICAEPEVIYSRDIETREWVIRTGAAINNIGGSN